MNLDSNTPRFAPVRPEALEMNEAEKRFLAAEEARLGCKLEELSKTPTYNMCFACGEANRSEPHRPAPAFLPHSRRLHGLFHAAAGTPEL